MQLQAMIVDFDNTIISTPEIGDELFAPLFDLLLKENINLNALPRFREEIMRKPFQELASKYQFPEGVVKKAIALLSTLTYNKPIATYPDYSELMKIECDKFLVTTGFTRMQQSKIEMSGVANDFRQVFIVDPEKTTDTKIDVFRRIAAHNRYDTTCMLVVGDNPDSEIKAGEELGMITVLYNPGKVPHPPAATYTITHYSQLAALLAAN